MGNEFDTFSKTFSKLLSDAQKRTGDKRTAAKGEQGHQKTPAFILAVIEDALQKGTHQPRGGFTDVGLHTGGSARATQWPLALAIVRFVMEQLHPHDDMTRIDFRCVLADWELWLAEASLNPQSNVEISDTLRMIQSAAERGAVLANSG